MTIADSACQSQHRHEQIARALADMNARTAAACRAANRLPHEVNVLAVSKTMPSADIRAAYLAGQRLFGENYVQEGIDKIAELADLDDISWHFIGPAQSNKTKDIAEHFAWMHSLDRLKIARRLDQQRPSPLPPLQVLIQVNIDQESSKSGIALAQLEEFAAEISTFERLNLRGLMAIPQAHAMAGQQHDSFARLATAYRQLQTTYPQVDTLSLGMSGDLDTAIAHGSTMVRIGTAIFGKRKG